MRYRMCILVIAALGFAGCHMHHDRRGGPESLTPERAAAVTGEVRAFMQSVAQDVTRDGPTAWRREFADTPAFFMAVDGRMAFADSAAVTAGLPAVAAMIKQIELKWGDDLRVDPLTRNLAVVGTSWHEVQVDAAGKRVEESGYFTGVVEYREGRWQFRDAHWSLVAPAEAAH
jgi:hypothetical protein